MKQGWENGIDARRFPEMTPAEVFGEIARNKFLVKQKNANMDNLAFLTGSYTGCAVNAPKKYPKEPKNAKKILEGRQKKKEMTDDEMKNAMLAFAQQNNARLKNNGLLGDTGELPSGGGGQDGG